MSICMAQKCITDGRVDTMSCCSDQGSANHGKDHGDIERQRKSTDQDTRKMLIEAGLTQGPITLPLSCVSFINKANL